MPQPDRSRPFEAFQHVEYSGMTVGEAWERGLVAPVFVEPSDLPDGLAVEAVDRGDSVDVVCVDTENDAAAIEDVFDGRRWMRIKDVRTGSHDPPECD